MQINQEMDVNIEAVLYVSRGHNKYKFTVEKYNYFKSYPRDIVGRAVISTIKIKKSGQPLISLLFESLEKSMIFILPAILELNGIWLAIRVAEILALFVSGELLIHNKKYEYI